MQHTRRMFTTNRISQNHHAHVTLHLTHSLTDELMIEEGKYCTKQQWDSNGHEIVAGHDGIYICFNIHHYGMSVVLAKSNT